MDLNAFISKKLLPNTRGAYNTCVIAKLGYTQAGLAGTISAVSFFFNQLFKRFYQSVALFAYSAANAKHLGLENVYYINKPACKIINIIVDNLPAAFIALSHCIKRCASVYIVKCFCNRPT
jgi:hypothetical protein